MISSNASKNLIFSKLPPTTQQKPNCASSGQPQLKYQIEASTDNVSLAKTSAATNPYLKTWVNCPKLTPVAEANINRVQFIICDAYPNFNQEYFKYINAKVEIPPGSTIEARSCNSHVNYVSRAAFGVNKQTVPSLKNIKVTYYPCLDCNGSGWEPNLTASLKAAVDLATQNSKLGINTITIWSIGGAYNTTAKIDLINQLCNLPRSYFVMAASNDSADQCVSPVYKNPREFIIGGTSQGNQIYRLSNFGPCVDYFLPGDYTASNGVKINGTSFAGPIFGYLLANYLLNNPDDTYDEVKSYFDAKSTLISTFKYDQKIDMKVFKTLGSCQNTLLVKHGTARPTL